MPRPRRNWKHYLAIILVIFAGVWALLSQQRRQVNDDLLKTGSKTGQEWVTYGVNWAEQRYSSLKEIDVSNVSRLGLAWSVEIPLAAGNPKTDYENTPLVFNGVLYDITPWSIVYAIELRTHKELWRSDPAVNQEIWQSRICCGVVANRGLALYQDKVIAPVVDGRLRALDALTGKVLWDVRVSPDTMPYTITMAPRIIKDGRVIIGVAGGDYAVRGFFSAYHVQDGKLAWRFYTVPGDPSKPFEHPDLEAAAKTWSNEWWKLGGGAGVWNGLAYDGDNDIVYVGTGQPGPWTSMYRGPGDNLYANSIVAVRGATGKLVWYYQEVPGDDWDYDSNADLMLLDLPIGGKTRQVIMHAPKSGFFYVLDRLTGEVLSADPFTKVSWASGLEPKTGKPNVNAGARYGTEAVRVMPAIGRSWQPWTYSPMTGLVYFQAFAGESLAFRVDPDYVPAPTDLGPTGRGQANTGTRGANPSALPTPPVPLPMIGPDGLTGAVMFAWDPIARKERWRVADGLFFSGTLSTGGNLVFSSVAANLMAYHAETGEKLFGLRHGAAKVGAPISFSIDGKQYIAVAGRPSGAPNPHLLVFALDGKAPLPGVPLQ